MKEVTILFNLLYLLLELRHLRSQTSLGLWGGGIPSCDLRISNYVERCGVKFAKQRPFAHIGTTKRQREQKVTRYGVGCSRYRPWTNMHYGKKLQRDIFYCKQHQYLLQFPNWLSCESLFPQTSCRPRHARPGRLVWTSWLSKRKPLVKMFFFQLVEIFMTSALIV